MATVLSKYAHTDRMFSNGWSWESDTFQLRLLTANYSFNPGHTVWTSASSAELATAGGYTANGKTLVCSSTNTLMSASDVIWTSLTATFIGGVVVRTGTMDGLTDALVMHFLWRESNIVLDGIDFLVRLSNGIFTLS